MCVCVCVCVCVLVNNVKESDNMENNWKTKYSEIDEFIRRKVDIKTFRF